MNTLQTSQVANLLDRLFAEAERSERNMRRPAGLDPLSKTQYREFYTGMKDYPLPVSRKTGTLLYAIARAKQASSVLEFGTSFGVSAIYLAAALRDNGGGQLITTEFEPGKVARARENLAAAGLQDLVDIREGDALQTLAKNLPPKLDLVLLDGAKGLYSDVLEILKDSLQPGAVILADDANLCPSYVHAMRCAVQDYVSVAIADDVEISVRL